MSKIISLIGNNVLPSPKSNNVGVNNFYIAYVDGDPTTGEGLLLPEGSIVIQNVDGKSKLFIKNGEGNTDWHELLVLGNSIPEPLGIASAGTSESVSREDHTHAVPALNDLNNVSVASPNDLDVLTYDNGTSTWVAVAPTVTPLSNNLPQDSGVASAGIGTSASRDDHTHAVPALNDLSNVSVASPNDLDILTYDNGTSTWVAAAPAGGLTDLTNVSGSGYAGIVTSIANADLIIGSNGTGAIQAQVADNTEVGGNARGTRAVDWQQERALAASRVASGNYSVIGGGGNNTASGSYGTVAGGANNTASEQYATVAGGWINTASGGWATVGGGYVNTASRSNATVGGGQYNTASGVAATVAGGDGNTASGTRATVGGGYFNPALGDYATVGGGQQNTASATQATVGGGHYGLANQYGMFSHASGRFATPGDAQYSRMVLRRQTTDATPTDITADGNAPATTTRVALPAQSMYCFEIYISATQTGGSAGTASDSAWWHIRGGIKRDNSNNTSLVGSLDTLTGSDAGAAAWSVAVTADDTNEALQIEVTGETNKTIRWVATVQYSRVAY